jgi:hypothetical protein
MTDSGSVAHVSFRVRCETLGHGEEVFLVKEDDVNLGNVSSEIQSYSFLDPSRFDNVVGPEGGDLCSCLFDGQGMAIHPIVVTMRSIRRDINLACFVLR